MSRHRDRTLTLDDREVYPEALCNRFDRSGAHRSYVPASVGGALRSFEQVFELWRAMAGQDLTAAIAHGKTLLGASPVWVSGWPEQRQTLAAIILRGEQVALALTERSHGSDLLATETCACRTQEGYRITGEKWLINNATRASTLLVYARTDPRGGPRGFDWFLVRKDRLDRRRWAPLPRVRTHGMRGADISGVRFDGAVVASDTLVGVAGGGFELTLKALQISRTLIPALSLGAAAASLQETLGLAASKEAYARSALRPQLQRLLLGAFLDLLVCEAVSVAAVRTLHVVPQCASLTSAVVKYLVPDLAARVCHDLARIAALLAPGRAESRVAAKTLRDAALLPLFDGSTAVNLDAIALQLPRLVQPLARGSCATAAHEAVMICALDRPVPSFDPRALTLTARGRDPVVASLSAVVQELRDQTPPDIDHRLAAHLLALGEEVQGGLAPMATLLERAAAQSQAQRSPEMFDLARRYALLHAAAACLQLWLRSRQAARPFFAKGECVALALNRWLNLVEPQRQPLPMSYTPRVWRHMTARHRCRRPLLMPVAGPAALRRTQM